MTTRFTLDDWGDDDLDLSVVAFNSSMPNYRFAFNLNKALNTLFAERINSITVSAKDEKMNYCVYRAESQYESDIVNLFLIENSPYRNDKHNASVGMFDNIYQQVRFYSRGKHQWDYLITSNDVSYTKDVLLKLQNPLIIASQLVDFKGLTKDRQHIIKDLYHENEC